MLKIILEILTKMDKIIAIIKGVTVVYCDSFKFFFFLKPLKKRKYVATKILLILDPLTRTPLVLTYISTRLFNLKDSFMKISPPAFIMIRVLATGQRVMGSNRIHYL